jgi:hypothetical protein
MIPIEPESDVSIPRIKLKSSNEYIVVVRTGAGTVQFFKVHNPPYTGEENFDLSDNDSIFVTRVVPFLKKDNKYDLKTFYSVGNIMEFTYGYYKSLNPERMVKGYSVATPNIKWRPRNSQGTRNHQGTRNSRSRGGKKSRKNRKQN